MDVVIREIETSDYDAVVSLWNHELGNSVVNAEKIAAFYDNVRGNAAYQTYVAVVGGRVAGFITTVEVSAIGLPVGYLKINGIAVREVDQHMGIGTALLNYVEGAAKKKGLSFVLLNSGIKRTDAHRFYEKNRYDKDSYCFDKTLICGSVEEKRIVP